MGDSKSWNVSRPKRMKVNGQAYFPAAIHFRRFAFQLGEFQFRRDVRISDGNLERQLELVLHTLVIIPTFPFPFQTRFVRLDREPVVVVGLVDLNVLDQRLVLRFQSR